MLVAMIAGAAGAADLHMNVVTGEGISETLHWNSADTITKRLGPRFSGKSSVVYAVNVPAAVYDATEGVYRVDLSLCLEWSRKGTLDRWCTREEAIAPAESDGPRQITGALKAKDKFSWSFELWFTGEPPETGMPPLEDVQATEDLPEGPDEEAPAEPTP
jgi:hypothetical protein